MVLTKGFIVNELNRITVREGSAGVRYTVAPAPACTGVPSMGFFHVASCSTGKDSVATMLIAKDRPWVKRLRAILCDTGNEHELVFEHRDYLVEATGIPIDILTANFDDEIAAKRRFIARDRRTRREYDTMPVTDAQGEPVLKRDERGNIFTKKVKRNGVSVDVPVQKTVKIGGGRRVRWSNKAKRRALAHLHPTGIPFLDLCMWKGRFPSRKAQFCTEHLKRDVAVTYQLDLVDQGYTVISWQGVRRDESLNRADAKMCERIGPAMFAFRPIVEFKAQDTFDYAARHQIKPNPLYKAKMGRVGCMPCINATKEELAAIGARFPAHIEKIGGWEVLVGACSKRQHSTFFPAPNGGAVIDNKRAYAQANNVYAVIQWANTTRGGKQFSLLTALEEPTACASSYGLCE